METKDPVVHHRFAPESQLAGHSLVTSRHKSRQVFTSPENHRIQFSIQQLEYQKLLKLATSVNNSPKVYQQMYQFNQLF